MRKLIWIFILISSFCHAQDYIRPQVQHHSSSGNSLKDSLYPKSYFFSFNMGVAIPMRDYGSKDTAKNFMIIGPDSTNGKGFADLGFHADINGGIFLTRDFGLMAKFALEYNSLDANTLNLIVNGYDYYTINSSYYIWQGMGGVFWAFQTNAATRIWLSGMVGLVHANFPSFTVNINTLNFNFSLTDANDFAYSFGINIEKIVSENVSFMFGLNYTGSELSYPTLTYNPNYYGTYTQHTPVTMSFGSLDISAGMLFHL